jgi:FixJ family two-component response regulator
MPHVDGRKVAASIKEMSPTTPVVLVTGWGQRLIPEGDVDAKPASVDEVLSKPPRVRELREVLLKVQKVGYSSAS